MTEHGDIPEDQRLGALYRRSARDEPAAAVDRAILEAARRAVSPRSRRSPLPWAIAATLVLGVGIGLQVLRLDPVPGEPVSEVHTDIAQEPEKHATSRAPVTESGAERLAPASAAPGLLLRKAPVSPPIQPDGEATTRFSSAAPAASAKADRHACPPYDPADSSNAQAWRDAIELAHATGDEEGVRCLEQQLRKLEAAPAESGETPKPAHER